MQYSVKIFEMYIGIGIFKVFFFIFKLTPKSKNNNLKFVLLVFIVILTITK